MGCIPLRGVSSGHGRPGQRHSLICCTSWLPEAVRKLFLPLPMDLLSAEKYATCTLSMEEQRVLSLQSVRVPSATFYFKLYVQVKLPQQQGCGVGYAGLPLRI